jgi:hypothetical protein
MIPPSGGVPFTGDWHGFPVGILTFTVTSTTLPVPLILRDSPEPGGLAGFQLVRLGVDSTPFCSGNSGQCPCLAGPPGNGCPSSFNPSGGNLSGTGTATIGTDTLVLHASGLSISAVTVIQGTTANNSGLGTQFGDGLLCAGGSILRLSIQFAAGGAFDYPAPGDPPISIAGGGILPGMLRTYQAWYRDSPAYCTSATFNLTNGVAVNWH